MLMKSTSEVVWHDDWIAKKPAAKLTPRAVSRSMAFGSSYTATRGVPELLEAHRSSAWLATVVNKIGYHFAIVPWQLHERPGRDAEGKRLNVGRYKKFRGVHRKNIATALRLGELSEIEQHPLLDLLANPNPHMGGVAYRDICAKYVDLTGESFSVIVRDPVLGIPCQLWPVSPAVVSRIASDANPTYEFSVNGQVLILPAEEVVYVRRHDLRDPFARGTGAGASLGHPIDLEKFTQQFVISFFYNGARPDMILSLPDASEDVVGDFQQKFEGQHRGARRAHRTFISDTEVKVTELRNDVGAEQSLPLLNHVRDTIISVFGVPPEIMGVLENSNRATINQAMTIFARETLMPRLELFADEWQRQLVPLFDENLLISYTNPVPEDDDFRLDVARAAPYSLTVEEWRHMGGWQNPQGADYDFHMVPMGLNATRDPAEPILAPGQPSIGGDVPGAGDAGPIDGASAPSDSSLATNQPLSQVTLNGAQMAGILAILEQVVLGSLPRESAIELILISVPVSRDQAEAILGNIGQGFEPERLPGEVPQADAPFKSVHKADDDAEARAARVLRRFQPDYLEAELNPVFVRGVEEWAGKIYEEIGIQAAFDMQNPRVKEHLKDLAGERIKGINLTTQDNLKRELIEGFRAGEGYADIADRVRDTMGVNATRAETIARTEVMRSSNFATTDAYKQSGVIARKQWVATVSDGRTRDEHLELNGATIPIDEDFEINGNPAQFPGDFGDPALDINCRCTIAPVVDDEEPKNADALALVWKAYDKKLAPWEQRTQKALLKAWSRQQRAILSALHNVAGG